MEEKQHPSFLAEEKELKEEALQQSGDPSDPTPEPENDQLPIAEPAQSDPLEQPAAQAVEPEVQPDKEETAMGENHDVQEEEEEEDEHDEQEEEVRENYNQFTREQLVELLEETVREPDISLIKSRIALIKVAFLKKSREDNEQKIAKAITEESQDETEIAKDTIEARFDAAFNIYKQNKAAFVENQEKQKQKNLDEKKQILEELKELIGSEETLKKTYDEFKILQDRWKEIGIVPKSEVNDLWQSYHFLVEKFFDKVKINKELKDLDLKKNLESKMVLCEKAEELLLERSINRSFKELQKLHEDWKEVGPVPTDKKDEIWQRFKAASDKINERRREFYTKLREEQENNYQTKLALCEKAEEVVSRKNISLHDWQANTSEMNEIFKIWRSIGTAPKNVNDQIWDRFKTTIDTFFNNKKEYFGEIKEQQVHNYNLKLDLCAQAESLKNNTDWKKTTQELIKLQKEWKSVGPVPRKHSSKIWKRFRAACDEFFNNKSEYYSHIQQHEEDNLNTKKELITKIKAYQFTDNKTENLNLIKEFQREWMEIGHVPIKEKDNIQNEFRAVINEQLDKLKISNVEVTTMNYKSRFENLKDAPGSQRILFRERSNLLTRMNQLKDDINLWENNIGFLAESKNAAILKAEFEKKINKAKLEFTIMEAKLKILNEQLA